MKFVCVKEYKMNNGAVAFIPGKVYDCVVQDGSEHFKFIFSSEVGDHHKMSECMVKSNFVEVTEQQKPAIKGQKKLTQEQIDAMNKVAEMGELLSAMLDELKHADMSIDHRWLQMGKSDLQKGIMFVKRSIGQPDAF